MICSSLWFNLETFFSTLTSHKKDEFYQIFMTNVTQHFAQTSSMNKPFSLFWSPWAHPEHTLSTLKDCSEITQTTLINNSESTQRTLGEHSLHLNGVHSCSKTSFFCCWWLFCRLLDNFQNSTQSCQFFSSSDCLRLRRFTFQWSMKWQLQQDSNRFEALRPGFFQKMGLLQGSGKAKGVVQRQAGFLEHLQESSKTARPNHSSSKPCWLHLLAQYLLLLALLFGLANGDEGDTLELL